MNEGLVSQRYAAALYGFALARKEENRVYEEMKLFAAQFGLQPALRVALANPALPKSSKYELAITAAGSATDSVFGRFITFVLEHEREAKLQNIALKYIELYRDRKNIYAGRITLARETDHKTEKRLISVLAKHTGGILELEKTIDSEIVGGFVLEADNCRWDASIKGKLQRIKRELTI